MANKKKVLAVAGIVVASAVFSASALAAVSNLSGYDKLKQAVFSMTEKAENITLSSHIALYENGNVFAAQDSLIMRENDKTFEKTTNNLKGNIYENEFYNDSQVQINVDGDTFYMHENSGYSSHGDASTITETQKRFASVLMDTLVGDTKNYVISEGNNISLTLSGNQIPELAQLGVSVMAEVQAANAREHQSDFSDMPELGTDTHINSVTLNGKLDDEGNLSEVTGSFKVSGVNTKGENTDVDFKFVASLTDVGSTVVIKPDTTGKTDRSSDIFGDRVSNTSPHLQDKGYID